MVEHASFLVSLMDLRSAVVRRDARAAGSAHHHDSANPTTPCSDTLRRIGPRFTCTRLVRRSTRSDHEHLPVCRSWCHTVWTRREGPFFRGEGELVFGFERRGC